MFTIEQANEELYTMLLDLKEEYQKYVLPGMMAHKPFCAEFMALNTHIDCKRALCLNYHERNMVILGAVLTKKGFLKKYLLDVEFSHDAFELLLCAHYQTTAPICDLQNSLFPGNKTSVPCRPLTEKQLVGITTLTMEYGMFVEENPTKGEVAALLNCEEGIQFKVKRLAPLVFMLDELQDSGIIRYGWQTRLERRKCLLNIDGLVVSRSNMSTTLSRLKRTHKVVYQEMANTLFDLFCSKD